MCLLTLNKCAGYHVAQVCVIFVLPEHLRYTKPLAYIEYFTEFTTQQQGNDLFKVHRSFKAGKREASIIALDSIRSSCHQIPVFGKNCNVNWTLDNVLELCNSFFLNSYLNKDIFQMIIG